MIRLIAAIDRKRGLAKHGLQPWHITADEQFFTDQTKSYGGQVLMGSITFQGLQGPLVERQNFVLTRDKTPVEGVELVHDLEKFLRNYQEQGQDLWVIGGANVFAQCVELGRADELYLTVIEADFGCTQFFPPYGDFQLAEQSELKEQNGFIFRYNRFVKSQTS